MMRKGLQTRHDPEKDKHTRELMASLLVVANNDPMRALQYACAIIADTQKGGRPKTAGRRGRPRYKDSRLSDFLPVTSGKRNEMSHARFAALRGWALEPRDGPLSKANMARKLYRLHNIEPTAAEIRNLAKRIGEVIAAGLGIP